MMLHELVSHSRGMLADTATPHEWTDAQLTNWINDAERRFAEATFCLLDTSSALTTIEAEKGVEEYRVHPRVIMVLAVRDDHGAALRGRFTPTHRSLVSGRPTHYTYFPGNHTLRLFPPPERDQVFRLVVSRLPMHPLCDPADEPEIPQQYHLALCDWVACQALRGIDADVEDRQRSDWYRTAWDVTLVQANRVFGQAATPTQHVVFRSEA